VDILQEHLIRARASGGVFARSAAVPPWGIRFPGTIQLAVHTVVRGRAWLWTGHGGDPLELAPGDLALVRGGPDHFIAHEPGARCVLPGEFRSLPADDAALSAPSCAVFLCGAYRFAGDIGRGLVAALPPVLSLPASVDDPIHRVVTLLSREMLLAEPGKQTVLDRLLDVLVVLGLRAGLTRSETAPPWFRAACDPRLSPALEAVHSSAAKPWTVDDLARLAVRAGNSAASEVIDAVGPERPTFLALVQTIKAAVGSRSQVIRVPGTLIPAAARVLGLALRDTLLTAEEYQAMADGLADTDGPATGETALSHWIADHQDTLGHVYANELTRHFR